MSYEDLGIHDGFLTHFNLTLKNHYSSVIGQW